MKKKTLVLLVMSMVMVLLLTACGGSNPKSNEALDGDSKTTEKYPVKPINIVVPFAAGGSVDMCARIIAPEAEKVLGQSVVVINKEGGGASIGQTYVVNSKPDGYTLLALTSSYSTNVMGGTVAFEFDAITPVSMHCFDPELIVVSSDSDIKTMEDFLAKGKAEPLLNSTPGHLTSHHIGSMMFTDITGCQFEYLHTNGSAEQVVQLAGGHAEVGMTTYGSAASLIDQGKIRALAVCDTERHPALPDIPTISEACGIDLNYGAWRGFGVPKGTPDEVIETLQKAFKAALETDAVKEQFEKAGFPLVYKSSQEFKEYLDADWARLLKLEDLINSK